jgi:hypothetical protein
VDRKVKKSYRSGEILMRKDGKLLLSEDNKQTAGNDSGSESDPEMGPPSEFDDSVVMQPGTPSGNKKVQWNDI